MALPMESKPPPGQGGESNTHHSTTTTAATAGAKEASRRRSSLEVALSGIFAKKSKTFPLLQDGEPPSPETANAPAMAPSNPPESHSKAPDVPTASPQSATSASADQPSTTAASASTASSDSFEERRRSSLSKSIINAVSRAASDSLLLVTTVAAPRRRSSGGVNLSRIAPDPALPTLMESQYSDVSSPPHSLPTTPTKLAKKEEEEEEPLTSPTAAGDSTLLHLRGLRSSSESMDDILNRKPTDDNVNKKHPAAPTTGTGTGTGLSLTEGLRRMSFRGQQIIHSLVANPEESGCKANPLTGVETSEAGCPADTTPAPRPNSGDMPRMSSKVSMRNSFRVIRSGIFGNRGSSMGLDSSPLDQLPPYLDRKPTVCDLRKYVLLRKSFLKYCDIYHPCQEKVLFLVALDDFLVLQEDDMVGQAAKMKAIDSDFIREGAPHDIGLGRVIRNTISKKADRYLHQSNLFWGTSHKDVVGSVVKKEEAGSTDAKKPAGQEKGDFDNLSQIGSDGGSSDDSDNEEEVVAVAALPTVTRKEVYALAEKEVEEYLTEFVLGSYFASDFWIQHIDPWIKAREELSKGSEGDR